MLHSMTGFARESAESELGTLSWELRAVNHRYLDLQFRLPDELRSSEAAFRQQVGGMLKRGKVDCTLHFRRAFDASTALELDQPLITLLGERLRQVATSAGIGGEVDPIDILRWPGVICEPKIETEPLITAAGELLDAAVASIQAMRASEGERIAGMLESRCAEIERLADAVKKRMPAVLEAAEARLRERIARLDVEADPGRLEVELALVAQKLDVAEEVERIESHVSEIRGVLTIGEPVGRRLDFLMQELNREANTLASKSADTETTRVAVDLKVLIEQMREQIQNVE